MFLTPTEDPQDELPYTITYKDFGIIIGKYQDALKSCNKDKEKTWMFYYDKAPK